MISDEEFKQAIQKLAGTFLKDTVSIAPCIVNSINLEDYTCDCTTIGGNAVTEIPNVKLAAEVSDGLLLVPIVGSTVIVCYSTNNKPFITMFSEVDIAYFITQNGIQLMGQEHGGLVICGKLIKKLNNLETAFNEINVKLNTLVPTPVIPPIEMTLAAEIENTAVKHGVLPT